MFAIYLDRNEVAPFIAGIGGGCAGGVTLLLEDALLYPALNTSCCCFPSVPTSVVSEIILPSRKISKKLVTINSQKTHR